MALKDAAEFLVRRPERASAAELLHKLILACAKEIGSQVAALRELSAELLGSEAVEDLLDKYDRRIDILNILLLFVDASEPTRIPQAIVQPLEALLADSLGETAYARVLVWYFCCDNAREDQRCLRCWSKCGASA